MLFEEVLPGLRAGKQYIARGETYKLVDGNLYYKWCEETWKLSQASIKVLVLDSDWTLHEEPPKELNFFEAVAVLEKGGRVRYWDDEESILSFYDGRMLAMSERGHVHCDILQTNRAYYEVKA